MAHRIEADGETWDVTVDRGDEAPGVNALVFHCISNPQRPYRVVEIDRAEALTEPEDLSDDRLRQLFAGSQVMDYTHDRDAIPDTPHLPGQS